MKHAWGIVIVLLLLSLGGNWIQYRSAELAQRDRNIEAKAFREWSKGAVSEITSRDSVISSLLIDRKSDSVRQVKKEASFISRISALKSKVSGPAVVQDTIILVQDSLITVIRNSRDTLYLTDNQVIDSLQRQVSDISGLFEGQLKQTIRAENELRREKKKRWSIGPSASYGFRGADVGISIQYSIFRF